MTTATTPAATETTPTPRGEIPVASIDGRSVRLSGRYAPCTAKDSTRYALKEIRVQPTAGADGKPIGNAYVAASNGWMLAVALEHGCVDVPDASHFNLPASAGEGKKNTEAVSQDGKWQVTRKVGKELRTTTHEHTDASYPDITRLIALGDQCDTEYVSLSLNAAALLDIASAAADDCGTGGTVRLAIPVKGPAIEKGEVIKAVPITAGDNLFSLLMPKAGGGSCEDNHKQFARRAFWYFLGAHGQERTDLRAWMDWTAADDKALANWRGETNEAAGKAPETIRPTTSTVSKPADRTTMSVADILAAA